MEYEKFQIEPFGVHVAHTWLEVGIVLDSINRLGIKRFVEIGVYKGGLAALLVHSTKHIPGFEYLGIEIDSQIVEPTVRKLFDPLAHATLWLRDAHARETVEDVRQWIQRKPGPALIYCDGGDKPKEFKKYALKHFNPLSLFHHYKSLCKKNYEKYLKSGALVTYKKYLYALRGLVNAKWVLQKESIPPIRFRDAVDKIDLPDYMKNKINDIVKTKAKGNEKDKIDELIRFSVRNPPVKPDSPNKTLFVYNREHRSSFD